MKSIEFKCLTSLTTVGINMQQNSVCFQVRSNSTSLLPLHSLTLKSLTSMEAVGTMQEGEWGAFGGMFSNEETNFMAQFINTYPFPSEHNGSMSLDTSSTFWPTHEPVMNAAAGFDESLYYCQDKASCNSYYLPRDISHTRDTTTFFPMSTGEQNFYINNNSFNPMEFCLEEQNPSTMNIVMEERACLKDEMSGDSLEDSEGSLQNAVVFPDPKLNSKRKCVMIQPDTATAGENDHSSESPKKKAKVSGPVRKNKKSVQSKKNQGNAEINTIEEGTNADTNGHSSSSYTSEDDTNVPQETSNSKGSDVLDLSCKSRASRGSATDPQSIYARKRRERINERLRILQNLVPNGTKVDISTMLEEAVQYVKFLQVQIKLLSSDDLWMYAPLAYNGMDIGLDLKITLPR